MRRLAGRLPADGVRRAGNLLADGTRFEMVDWAVGVAPEVAPDSDPGQPDRQRQRRDPVEPRKRTVPTNRLTPIHGGSRRARTSPAARRSEPATSARTPGARSHVASPPSRGIGGAPGRLRRRASRRPRGRLLATGELVGPVERDDEAGEADGEQQAGGYDQRERDAVGNRPGRGGDDGPGGPGQSARDDGERGPVATSAVHTGGYGRPSTNGSGVDRIETPAASTAPVAPTVSTVSRVDSQLLCAPAPLPRT